MHVYVIYVPYICFGKASYNLYNILKLLNLWFLYSQIK